MLRLVGLILAMVMMAASAQAQSAENLGFREFAENLVLPVPDEPIKVRAGVQIVQITSVDQKAENFSVVARLRMEWTSPGLAFDPDASGGRLKIMDTTDFVEFARESGIAAPVASYENLQARSFTKHSAVAWDFEGNALHTSEIVLTLQAPDFNFRHYPYDKQMFFVRVLLNAPKEIFEFEVLEDFSGMGDALGEEEWIVRSVWTQVDTTSGIAGWESSRFSLGFSADRHLIYYWMRFFLPLLLLVIVSWANLFLQEYRRRIDIAGANLLAFIAFNFTVSGELPRLGYITFLDALFLAMFILSALTVAYNVMLRRMSIHHMEETARAIDWHVTFWAYPLIYAVTVLSIWAAFFV